MNSEKMLLVERAMKFMPWTVQPSDSVAHARAILDDEHINNLPVLSKGKLVGVVSARDLRASKRCKTHAIKSALETHPDRVRVASVMTTTVYIVRPKDTLAAAATLMRRKNVGALPVMEGDRLLGIINRSDIIATLSASRRGMNRSGGKGIAEPAASARRWSKAGATHATTIFRRLKKTLPKFDSATTTRNDR